MQATIQASPQNAKERDFSALNHTACNPITLNIRVEIDATETLTASIVALIEALKSAAPAAGKIGPAEDRKSNSNESTAVRERFGKAVENAEKFAATGSTVNAETASNGDRGAFCQIVENPENSAGLPAPTTVETAAKTPEGQSGQLVDFPENSPDAADIGSAPVNSPEGAEKSPADGPEAPAASDVALMEARQVSTTDATLTEARQVQEEPEKQSSAITIMEVTRLITDIRNEFSELFTPERAKQFTEEIHKRSGVSYPPKTPEECVRMHTALMAMRRVLRFNRNKRNG